MEESAQTDKNTKGGRKGGRQLAGGTEGQAHSSKRGPEVRLRRDGDVGGPTAGYSGQFLLDVKFKLIENYYS